MNEKEFLVKYIEQKEYLLKWGEYVKESITKEISDKNIIKIPIYPRLKEDHSIIAKAFYRGKNYENPIDDITDKVGIRIVVLIIDDIEYIKSVVEKSSIWEYSKDRDFEDEREKDPALFQYQSVHYVVRNKKEILLDSVRIPKGTPCEIQIRTLLQHSYSELTHDTIYKSNKKRDVDIYRYIARSMALIETTDNIFREVNSMITKQDDKIKELLEQLKIEYTNISEFVEDDYIVNKIIESYEDQIKDIDLQKLKKFFCDNRKLLSNIIPELSEEYIIFKNYIILLIFYLVNEKQFITKKNWPFTDNVLEPIYTVWGFSFDID